MGGRPGSRQARPMFNVNESTRVANIPSGPGYQNSHSVPDTIARNSTFYQQIAQARTTVSGCCGDVAGSAKSGGKNERVLCV
jgi:hypothetical protein